MDHDERRLPGTTGKWFIAVDNGSRPGSSRLLRGTTD
jgi:hypothetical protein